MGVRRVEVHRLGVLVSIGNTGTGKIDGILIGSGYVVKYLVSWWDGNSYHEAWLSEDRVYPIGGDDFGDDTVSIDVPEA